MAKFIKNKQNYDRKSSSCPLNFKISTQDLRGCSLQVNLVGCNFLAPKCAPKTPVTFHTLYTVTKQYLTKFFKVFYRPVVLHEITSDLIGIHMLAIVVYPFTFYTTASPNSANSPTSCPSVYKSSYASRNTRRRIYKSYLPFSWRFGIRFATLFFKWQILLHVVSLRHRCSSIFTRTFLLWQPVPRIWTRGTKLGELALILFSTTYYVLESESKKSVMPCGWRSDSSKSSLSRELLLQLTIFGEKR